MTAAGSMAQSKRAKLLSSVGRGVLGAGLALVFPRFPAAYVGAAMAFSSDGSTPRGDFGAIRINSTSRSNTAQRLVPAL